MARIWRILVLFTSASALAVSQQTVASTTAQATNDQPERVKVYSTGPGVTSPQLLPGPSFATAEEKCRNEVSGTVVLSIIVDTAGRPRNPLFLQPANNELDVLALRIAVKDLFTPGTHDGVPAVIGQSLKITLHVCEEKKETKARRKIPLYRLISLPEQQLSPLPNAPEETTLEPSDLNTIGGSIKAPVLIHSVNAEFTEAARRGKHGGICILSLVVDRNGMPRDVRIVKALGYGLNEKAVEAAQQYRFKPAMKDSEPVPVTIHVEVSFKLY